MNVAQLHKALAKLIEAGHGRKPICINKSTFTHPLEDEGAVILAVEGVTGPQWIPASDDDGGTKWNADGSESGRRTVVLVGDAQQCKGGGGE